MIAIPYAGPSPSNADGSVKSLRFTPTCWAKLRLFRDLADVQIGAFGISTTQDPLLIVDIVLPRQACTPTSTALLDDHWPATHSIDRKTGPAKERKHYHWITVRTDMDCTADCLSTTFVNKMDNWFPWWTNCTVAQNDTARATLMCNIGPGLRQSLVVLVDFQHPFNGSDHVSWRREYEAAVQTHDPFSSPLNDLLRSPDLCEESWHQSEWVAS